MDLKALKKALKVHTRPGSRGRTYEYVKSKDVIDRMNTVFNGRWGSRVVSSEVIGEYVIVQCEVTVSDGEDRFSHVGYGGAALNSPDIGGRYKAALSLAIRNACSKWGVALGAEEPDEGDYDSQVKSPPAGGYIPVGAPGIPSLPKGGTDQSNPAALPNTAPPSFTPPQSTSSVTPPSTPPTDMPTVDTLPPQNKGTEPPSDDIIKSYRDNNTPSTPNDIPVPPPPAGATPPPNSQSIPTASSNEVKMINAVQQQSINSLITMKRLDFNVIVKEVFEQMGLPIESAPSSASEMDKLTHEQAIAIIKYGNSAAMK